MKKKISVLLFSGICIAAAYAAEKRPNVLWIVTDDQRPDSLACFNRAVYGTDESPLGYVESPNVDALADEGVLFTRAICNSPACGPSRGSMHSGRYPFRNGHYQFELTHQFPDFVKPIIHQTLRKNGYSTAVFGKSDSYIYTEVGKYVTAGLFGTKVHFKHDLQANGFGDIYAGGYSPDGTTEKVMYPDGSIREYFLKRNSGALTEEDIAERRKTDKEFDILRADTEGFYSKKLIYGGVNPQPDDKTIDAYIVKEFKSYLDHADTEYSTCFGRKQQGVPTAKPAMTEIGFRLPHTPVLPPKSFRDRFQKKSYRVPEFSNDEVEKLPPQLQQLSRGMKVLGTPEDISANRAYTPEKFQQAVQDYYAFCAHGDQLIGEAVKEFKKYCAENKRDYLIIYTVGDHGWQLGEQGIETKFSPWRESVHNAAIVVSSDKTKFPAGKVYDGIVEYVDFMPTILAAAGVDIHDPQYDYMDGYDLAEVLSGKAVKREYALGEMNLIYGPRAYMRSEDFAFSMRTRPNNGKPQEGNLNKDIKWALECPVEKAELALYDLRRDPLERNNVANDPHYRELAAWFRQKLGNIVLGDGRVECDWNQKNSYKISTFAKGADDKKLDIPAEIVPAL
ncbi:sulfatase-like hydrolase/transferase [Pontiella agarivorans]|uniref:Sulfatase-like hydrolase/transferase n=1 Tax=Pontiella agarivorans TaxID=3038953 RepID=A0ABU5N248_9BACT|nr:sulfatase-like hydrolase/transferase [Pontiella agarivorans]MDZ8120524.1 sulfatase-like hydrolase/transferase [Pontiella agarivorans]